MDPFLHLGTLLVMKTGNLQAFFMWMNHEEEEGDLVMDTSLSAAVIERPSFSHMWP